MCDEQLRRELYARVAKLDPHHAFDIFGFLLRQQIRFGDSSFMARLARLPHPLFLSWVILGKKEVLLRYCFSPSSLAYNCPPINHYVYDPILAYNTLFAHDILFCHHSYRSPYYNSLNLAFNTPTTSEYHDLPHLNNPNHGFNSPTPWNYQDNHPHNSSTYTNPNPSFNNLGPCEYQDHHNYWELEPDPLNLQREIHQNHCENEIGSLDYLEMELVELLQDRAAPISIASLPKHYLEKYGKPLKVKGYLTESQRQGKTGFSLTKALSRFNNTISIIDRPCGQHLVVLVEDTERYANFIERQNLKEINSRCCQIYLTFPPDSTFTEDDLLKHFRTYGPIEDVRIPYQQKRTFAFVTFVNPESANYVLAIGKPQYICGDRVLVKPYRGKRKYDKSTLADEEDQFPSSRITLGCNIMKSRYSFSHLIDGILNIIDDND